MFPAAACRKKKVSACRRKESNRWRQIVPGKIFIVEEDAEYEYDDGGATVRLVETASNLQEVALLKADGYTIAEEPYTTLEGDTIWTMEKFIEEGNGMVYDYVANNPRFGEKILEESIDSESPYEGRRGTGRRTGVARNRNRGNPSRSDGYEG